MVIDSVSTYTFSVEGMHCSQCLKKIKNLKETLPGIFNINVDMSRQIVHIDTEAEFNSLSFVKKMTTLGFQTRELKLDQEKEDSNKKKNKIFLARLGIAGALTGNIMLLSYAVYLGAPIEFEKLFSGLSSVLYLPILFYSAYPFFQSSWLSIKNMRLSIDLPIAIALFFGTLLSFNNLIMGQTEVYFDSLACLIFLLLTTRYIVFRFQRKYLSPVTIKDLFPNDIYYKITNNSEEKIIGQSIQKDHVIKVEPGCIIPVDGILLSSKAEVDNSLMTGESDPIDIYKWAPIYAGTTNLNTTILIQAEKNQKDSRVSTILKKLNFQLQKESRITRLTDQFANIFTLIVILLGGIFFSVYAFIDLPEALNRVLALLVIACPCALAVTSPLILRIAMKKSLKKNFLIKNEDVFEKILKCNTLVFDKTGTLTMGSVNENSWFPRRPTNEEAQIIFSLEKNSSHPVAQLIIKSLHKYELTEIKIDQVKSTEGVGVSGSLNNDRFELRRSHQNNGDIGFFKNQIEILTLRTKNHIHTEVMKEIETFKKNQFQFYLITGDKENKAKSVSKKLGIPEQNVYSEVSPEWKAHFIDSLKEKKVIYLGDGMNDSIAMAKSEVGISMQQSVDATFAASDIHVLNSDLSQLSFLYRLSKKTFKTIRALLIFSFSYNLFFGSLALLGYITPLIASILMPTSSLTLLGLGIFSMYGEPE